MGSLSYIVRKSIKNYFKQLKNKPAKAILYILFIALLVFILIISPNSNNNNRIKDGKEIFNAIVTIATLYAIFSAINAGTKNGKSLFRLSDVNFLFTAPIQPQRVLLYGFLKELYKSIMMLVLLLFQIPNLYNLFSISKNGTIAVVVGIFMLMFSYSTIAVLIYSIAAKEERYRNLIKNVFNLLLGLFGMGFLWTLFKVKSIKLAFTTFLGLDMFSRMPFIGWNINIFNAAIEGINNKFFINLLGVLLSIIFIIYIVYILKTDYYEDAMSATEINERKIERAKKGKGNVDLNKPMKRKNIIGILKSKGAKSIFERQLLEYKRSGFVFVDKMTLIMGISSLVFGFFMSNKNDNINTVMYFAIYMLLIFTFQGKWSEELSKPYIYLIPESSGIKIFYATLSNHIKNFVDGFVLFLICGIIFKTNPIVILLATLTYVSFGAIFVYVDLVLRRFFGGNISKVIETTLKFILLIVVVSPGIIISIVLSLRYGGVFGTMSMYFAMILYNCFISFIGILLSKGIFEKIEMK
ncbi:putative ABC exporter domain-containing protein [Clostridium sporogenes]|uniref:ABC exporter domain-containing protein n=1 Tax=Clostridium sporogenes TaxID=1509 RepID=A0AAE4FJZ6_CLOSG|nr:putative ABC exporter domain-containing protein [Clostridium sporogenes]MDS1003585.1 putative ABC exporter domain-containing protein [Clostridium sporogenes]